MRSLILCLCVAVLLPVSQCFSEFQKVPFHVNTLFPQNNPMETRRYYSLPYCRPQNMKLESDFAHSLSGDRPMTSNYEVNFATDVIKRDVCEEDVNLTPEETNKFVSSIDRDEKFDFLLDENLPIVGYVGFKDETPNYFLFTHLQFDFVYNGGTIMGGNISMNENEVTQIIPDQQNTVRFSYAVRWSKTEVPTHRRPVFHAKLQGANPGLVEEVHWLSIINSTLLVVLLTGGLVFILIRVVKNDFTRYLQLDEVLLEDGEEDVVDDSGWKMVHGDVFRPPKHTMLFSACIGTGTQIFCLVLCILLMSLFEVLHPGATRGAVYVGLVFLYALTAGIAGYTSGKLYNQLGGDRWSLNAILTASMFAVPFCVTFAVINSMAIYYNSTSALPFKTIMSLILITGFVTVPLTLLGGRLGFKYAPPYNPPCKTNKIVRFIPECPWYHEASVHFVAAGFLPFTAIYIELHTIFNSIWGYQVYTLFGILGLAFLLLLIVTSFVTITLGYLQLTTENYHWWWRSFLCGGATGVFIYAYAIFFYVYRSDMDGALQGTMFFGYMLMISYAFALMLGSIGYNSVSKFIRHIYTVVKVD